ncbi:hypothetical protein EIP91_008436 [Steccherinum ochraceum]|uniref:Uncharacterized protein n=1 Tax=Steccherinum ochraceum TaxID=92696 RepID=A0A4R0RCW2_9APHY|nr:hypothetical protein EIP91_008436 [Steccherinum ochraceum]
MVYIENIKCEVTLMDARTRTRQPINPASRPVYQECHSSNTYIDGQDLVVTVPVKVVYGQEFYLVVENRNPEALDDESGSESDSDSDITSDTDFNVTIRIAHWRRQQRQTGSIQTIYGIDCSQRRLFKFPDYSRHLRFLKGVHGKITIDLLVGSILSLPARLRDDEPQPEDSDDDVSDWGGYPMFNILLDEDRCRVVFEYQLVQSQYILQSASYEADTMFLPCLSSGSIERSKERKKRQAVLQLLRSKVGSRAQAVAFFLRKRRQLPTRSRPKRGSAPSSGSSVAPGAQAITQAGDPVDGSLRTPRSPIPTQTQPSRESSFDDTYWTPNSFDWSPGPSGAQVEGATSNAVQRTSDALPQLRSRDKSLDELPLFAFAASGASDAAQFRCHSAS